MYRNRFYQVVKYGKFREFKDLFDQINALCEQKGMTKFSGWAPVVGENNAFVIEADYADLTTWERETDQFYSDPEVMTLWRQAAAVIIEGTGHSELLTQPPSLA
jgi:hypothetical protein